MRVGGRSACAALLLAISALTVVSGDMVGCDPPPDEESRCKPVPCCPAADSGGDAPHAAVLEAAKLSLEAARQTIADLRDGWSDFKWMLGAFVGVLGAAGAVATWFGVKTAADARQHLASLKGTTDKAHAELEELKGARQSLAASINASVIEKMSAQFDTFQALLIECNEASLEKLEMNQTDASAEPAEFALRARQFLSKLEVAEQSARGADAQPTINASRLLSWIWAEQAVTHYKLGDYASALGPAVEAATHNPMHYPDRPFNVACIRGCLYRDAPVSSGETHRAEAVRWLKECLRLAQASPPDSAQGLAATLRDIERESEPAKGDLAALREDSEFQHLIRKWKAAAGANSGGGSISSGV